MNEGREKNLYISEVKHKTFCKVDEKGTSLGSYFRRGRNYFDPDEPKSPSPLTAPLFTGLLIRQPMHPYSWESWKIRQSKGN